jgi:Domain of unknown function (DUF4919)
VKPSPHLLLVLAFGCLWVASPSLAAQGANAAASPSTPAPPRRDWSEPPDFEALRAEVSARADFDALCETGRPLTAAFEQMQAARWNELLALTESWTQRCPVDMEAHSLRALALASSGRNAEAADHEMWARGLFEAALASGDGKTPETAYRVVAEFEEYALLRAFRYPPKRQAKAPNGADELMVRADGEEQTLYFAQLAHVVPVVAKAERRRR